MQALNKNTTDKPSLPIKVLQFGEGNFLRAFADWMIDVMNEKLDYDHGVAIVQPIDRGMTDMLRDQDSLYHQLGRGLRKGEAVTDTRLVKCVQQSIDPFKDLDSYKSVVLGDELKIVISNTTEAGIVYKDEPQPSSNELAETFPGKVTQLLFKRFNHFNGDITKGLVFIPVELIEKNGEKLKEAILKYASSWGLPADFAQWVENHNAFANTLVDRIVPGFPKDEIDEIKVSIGFDDNLVVASELFHLWVIQSDADIQSVFPANEAGLNVIFTNNLAPYRTRKVRILNGAHTSMVPMGLLNGIQTVREAMEDPTVGGAISDIVFNEIAPTIDLPADELKAYAEEVLERFRNPFIIHQLQSISLNSIPKFSVRVLPTLLASLKMTGELPKGLCSALAHLIALYLSDDFEISDDQEVKDFFNELKSSDHSEQQIANAVLGLTQYWNQDLNEINGMTALIAEQLTKIKAGVTVDSLLD
ncbi:MAG: tagaturonate reductase [Cyclobacteriaceae bacterium]